MDKLSDPAFYAFADAHAGCPASFKCPISLALMREPYSLSDGHTYDKSSIDSFQRNWSGNYVSPLSRETVDIDRKQKNFSLISMMDEWLTKLYDEWTGSGNSSSGITNAVSTPTTIPHKPLHLTLVIDTSGSMSTDCDLDSTGDNTRKFTRLDIVKHAINTIATSLSPEDHLTVVRFSNTAETVFSNHCTDVNKRALQTKIASIQPNGTTDLASGLKVAFSHVTSAVGSSVNNNCDMYNHILVLTDGEVNSGNDRVIDAFLTTNPNFREIPVTTVGISNESKSEFLFNLANTFGSYFIYINDASTVATSFANFIANTFVTPTTDVEMETDDSTNHNIDHYRQKYIEALTTVVVNHTAAHDKFVPLFEEVNAKIASINTTASTGTDNTNYHKFLQELAKDYNDEGEVFKAVADVAAFRKWGKNYLYALLSAHITKTCTNFKDKSTQYYLTPVQLDVSNRVLNIFSTIHPVAPSGSISGSQMRSRNSSYSGTRNARGGHVDHSRDMSSYIDVDNGCFHGDSEVLMVDGVTTKKIAELTGDEVLFNGWTIRYVVKMRMKKVGTISCVNGVKVTCYHPMMVDNKWIFPIDHPSAKQIQRDSDYLYNIVLNEGHYIVIDNIHFVSLGHGLVEFDDSNKILEHPFFGTNAVIATIEKFKTCDDHDNSKLIVMEDYEVSRCPVTGLVNGYI